MNLNTKKLEVYQVVLQGMDSTLCTATMRQWDKELIQALRTTHSQFITLIIPSIKRRVHLHTNYYVKIH